MNKPVLLFALLAALGVGWLIGSMTAGSTRSAATDDETLALREEVARLRLALGERGPTMRGASGTSASPSMGGGDDPGEVLPPPPATYGKTETFDIASFDDPDAAFQALLAYAATMLDRGEEGHFALLETISATFFEKPGETITEDLVGGEEQAMRFMYPILRFAMNREDQVADLTETVFKTMADDPKRFEALDDDTLELFTEGVAPMLPGMVGPTRIERFRGHARRILASELADQPHPVQRQRRDVQKALASWAPRMTKDEAFQRLQQGDISPEEATALLRRLDPADIARLDIDGLIGPLIERDPWTVISVLGRTKLDEGTRDRLDGRIIQAVADGRLKQTVVHYWLRYTGRESFDQARGFIERGLQASPKATAGTFLLTAIASKPGPDGDWLQWAEGRFEFSDEVRVALIRMREREAKK